MALSQEKIELIAQRKVEDYLQNILIRTLWEDGVNALEEAKKMQDEAFKKCKYDDPSIEEDQYNKLQEAIEKQLQRVFSNMLKKIEQQSEYL